MPEPVPNRPRYAAAKAYGWFTASLLLIAQINFTSLIGLAGMAFAVHHARQAWPDLPSSRLVGKSEVWHEGGTGVKVWWLLWFPVVRTSFHHSTAWLD